MTRVIRFSIVRREEFLSTSTVAIVSAQVSGAFDDSEHSSDVGAVQGAIMSAVTDWINETEEGLEAWSDSHKTFNIGDLSYSLSSEALQERLRRYGIENLEIDITDGELSNWEFDEVLANDIDLKTTYPRD